MKMNVELILNALEFRRDALITHLDRRSRNVSKAARIQDERELAEIERELARLGHPKPHGMRKAELRKLWKEERGVDLK